MSADSFDSPDGRTYDGPVTPGFAGVPYDKQNFAGLPYSRQNFAGDPTTPQPGAAAPGQPLCGPNADDQYCPRYWELSAECDALAEENTRLRMLIGELLDSTGLDDAERAEWLDRNRLSESAVYPDDDAEETAAILADPDTMAAIAEGEADL